MLSYIKSHNKALITFIGLMVAVVVAATLGIYFVAIKSEKTPIAIDENGNELISGKVYDMPSNLMFTSDVEEVSDNDGIILRATVKPDVAYNKTLDWTVAFSGNGSWATGKQATDYVTVTPTADGSDTATVKCLQPFGQAIEIQVTARSNPNAKANCKVDYIKKITASGVSFDYTVDTSAPYLGKVTFPVGGGEVDAPAPDYSSTDEYKYQLYGISTTIDAAVSSNELGVGTLEPVADVKDSIVIYARMLPTVVTALTNAGFINVPTEFERVTPLVGAMSKLSYFNFYAVLLPITKQADYSKDTIITEAQFYKPWAVLKGISGNQFELKYEYTGDNGIKQSVIHQYRFSNDSRIYKAQEVHIDKGSITF